MLRVKSIGTHASRAVLRQAVGDMSSRADAKPSVFRVGGVSYLRIPAEDPRDPAAFYEAVFGWRVGGDPAEPSFEDGSGHVIGHFIPDLPVAGEAGVRPYVFVERVDETLDKVVHTARSRDGAVSRGRSAGGDVPRSRR